MRTQSKVREMDGQKERKRERNTKIQRYGGKEG